MPRPSSPPGPVRRIARALVAASLAVGLGALPARADPAVDGEWSELAPPQRWGHVAIVDPVYDQLLILGGSSYAGASDQLWEYPLGDAGIWRVASSSGAAASGILGSAAFLDAARGRVIVVGASSHVWTLSLVDRVWSDLGTSAGRPAGLAGAALTYDPVRDRLVFFGGRDPCPPQHQCPTNAVWTLAIAAGAPWTPLAPAGTPPAPRWGSTAVYDPRRDRVIVLGGVAQYSGFTDAWSLDLSGPPAWTPLLPDGSGPGAGHYAFYDGAADQALVLVDDGATPNDVWALPLAAAGSWQHLAPAGTPPSKRFGESVALDPERHRLLLYGGVSDGCEVWALGLDAGGAWSLLSGAPPGRWGQSAIADVAHGRTVMFGGWRFGSGPGGFDYFADVWVRPFDGSRWTPLSTAGPAPEARLSHSAVYDSDHQRMIVFGGETSGPTLNDLWALSLDASPAWTPLAAAGTPPSPRSACSAIYDPVGKRMILFAGWNDLLPTTTYDETWALSLGASPAWTLLSPLGIPPGPRTAAATVYDSRRQRMLVLGGNGSASGADQVWALGLDGPLTWTNVPALADPGAHVWGGAFYDSLADRVIAFGAVDDVWALTLGGTPQWTRLAPAGPVPTGRVAQPAFADPAHRRLIVFGGYSPGQGINTYMYNDTWGIDWGAPESITGVGPPSGATAVLTIRSLFPNPSHSGWSVTVAAGSAGRARLELLDLGGRRIAARDVSTRGTGADVLSLPAPAALAPGVYVVRLSQGARSVAVRAALIR